MHQRQMQCVNLVYLDLHQQNKCHQLLLILLLLLLLLLPLQLMKVELKEKVKMKQPVLLSLFYLHRRVSIYRAIHFSNTIFVVSLRLRMIPHLTLPLPLSFFYFHFPFPSSFAYFLLFYSHIIRLFALIFCTRLHSFSCFP